MADSDSNNSSIEDVNELDDFKKHLLVLKAQWKAALKKNKKLLLKCPNFERCQSKCGSVGGMQYHYERCTGNAPRFKCEQCGRTYESRTGLNYHMASSHVNEGNEEVKNDSSSRPQRSTALNTMSAIHISNNPPPLKQSPTRTPPLTYKTHPSKTTPPTPPPVTDLGIQSPKLPPSSTSEEEEEILSLASKSGLKKSSSPTKVSVKSEPKEEVKGKKMTKYVTIPSIEYPDEYKSFLPVWRQEMKENKIIKCPNYKECDFKCTTVNGMKYHFVRCKKANPPEFNCELCGKKFQCRTGLVWHLKKTHKLIDIQPSKSGGFKGTLPAKLVMAPVLSQELSSQPRKKLKLNDGGRENRSPGGQKTPHRSFSRRKRYTPHKMPDEILQNVVMLAALPSPKLGPQIVKEVLVPLSQYDVFENIPTDEAHTPSTVIQLDEDALSWQRLSSDSESEGEYNPDIIYDDDMFGGYRSGDSLSDSDDDYMFGGGSTKKKVKQKSNGGGGMTVRSAAPRRGRPPKNLVKEESYESIPLESLPLTLSTDPLPLATEREQKQILPRMPALIKTSNASTEEASLEHYTSSLYNTSTMHVQPPPGLIMPVKTEHSMLQKAHKLPDPPPLLKNDATLEISDTYPHIVLPPATTQSWTPTHTTPTTPAPRRPGRPPKNKSGVGKDRSGKKATTIRLGSTKRSKGQPHSVKGMKMTRYEFQSPSSHSNHTTHVVTDSTPSQPSIVSFGGSQSTLQNIITPVQIIQGVPSTAMQMQTYQPVQTVQPGSMVVMQGGYNPQPSPSYITQDGQTYQILQTQSPHLTLSETGDNSQKISVIMQTPSGAGGIQYLSQLDGPPPLPKAKDKRNKKDLKAEFEAARSQEQTKLQSSPAGKQIKDNSSGIASKFQASLSSGSAVAAGSEDKVNKHMKVKEAAHKPKHNVTKLGAKGQKLKSSSVNAIIPVTEKSPSSGLRISCNPVLSSSFSVGMETGNGILKTPPVRPKSKTPAKYRNKTCTSNLVDLFQPDNIPQTIQPLADSSSDLDLMGTAVSVSDTELNTNNSNSNDKDKTNQKSSKSQDSSRARSRKRARTEDDKTILATASSAKKESTSETPAGSTKKGRSTSGKGKAATRGKGKATISEDSTATQSEDRYIQTPSKKSTPGHKEKGNVKKLSYSEASSLTTVKLGKRPREDAEQQPSTSTAAEPLGTSKISAKTKATQSTTEMETEPNTGISKGQPAVDQDNPSTEPEQPEAPPPTKKRKGHGKSSNQPSPSRPGPSQQVRGHGRGRGRDQRSVSDRNKFNCEKCDAGFASAKSLGNHIATVHDTQLDVNTPLADCTKVWRKAIKIAKSVVCSKCEVYRAVNVEAIKYHWARCNKEEEDFTIKCPHCDKEYKSEAGLKYHLRSVHITPSPQPSQPTTPEPPFDPTLPLPPRKAATNATKKLAKLTTEPTISLPSPSNASEGSTPSPSPALPKGGVIISPELRAAFQRKETVVCPNEGCDKKFTTLPGLRYHLSHHGKTNKYRCPHCLKVLLGVKRFENHIRSKHPDGSHSNINVTDHEYIPNDEPEESDNELQEDWEAEKDDIDDSPKSSRKSSGRGNSHKKTILAKWMHKVPQNYDGYQEKVEEVYSQLYGEWERLAASEWQVKGQHWKKVPNSDVSVYLPECQNSMPFVVHRQGSEKVNKTHTLPLFGRCEPGEGMKGGVFFTGGPVWAMDWLPVNGERAEHYVALSAYKRLDETFQMKSAITQPGLIQLWRVGALTNNKGKTPDVQFSLGLAHNFGVVRDLMWCPSVRHSQERGAWKRLGVLGVACSDGTVKIIAVPEPEELSQQLSQKPSKMKGSIHTTSLIVSVETVAALLVPSGVGVSDWSDFGQCLCLDWLPSSKHTKIAAGFSNGVVCVWDLELTHPILPVRQTRGEGLVIHPVAQLTAHRAPCRTVTWCPHDPNYLFTGGHDKYGSVWDLRQPYTPIERQEKGMLLNSKWPLLWNEVLLSSDVTTGAYNTIPVSALSYHHPPSGNRPSKNLLHCSTPITSISYCPWSDRVAAGSYGGEVGMVTLPTQVHLLNMIYSDKGLGKNLKQEVMWLNHCERMSPEPTPTCSSATSISKLVQTHRLVLTPRPSKKVLKEHCTLAPDDTPLQATTKVAWSPNKISHEWMLVASNTGLVQLLHIRPPAEKPLRFHASQCYQSTVC